MINTSVQHYIQNGGGPGACAIRARGGFLVQGMPQLVAQGHKSSGNACMVSASRRKELCGVTVGQKWEEQGCKEPGSHPARCPSLQLAR